MKGKRVVTHKSEKNKHLQRAESTKGGEPELEKKSHAGKGTKQRELTQKKQKEN